MFRTPLLPLAASECRLHSLDEGDHADGADHEGGHSDLVPFDTGYVQNETFHDVSSRCAVLAKQGRSRFRVRMRGCS
jgi:hypothetical protein